MRVEKSPRYWVGFGDWWIRVDRDWSVMIFWARFLLFWMIFSGIWLKFVMFCWKKERILEGFECFFKRIRRIDLKVRVCRVMLWGLGSFYSSRVIFCVYEFFWAEDLKRERVRWKVLSKSVSF